jgi:hypothetical protein
LRFKRAQLGFERVASLCLQTLFLDLVEATSLFRICDLVESLDL